MRRRLLSESQVDKEYFNSLIEQQKVDDITIGVFYRSRTLTVLVIIWLCLAYFAFSRSSTQPLQYNLYHASMAVCVIFLLISVMIMPNGPFIRPHPALWRMVFGASLLYFLCLVAVVFLRLDEARAILIWVYPELKHMRHSDILDKEYAVNCSQVAFSHILPNFNECWWDSLILDILVCNGLGIQCGMWLCRWLEMRDYQWDSIRNIPSARGKLKLWQLAELNSFFLKHIFIVKPSHILTQLRLLLITCISAPAISAIILTELLVCLKLGSEIFENTVFWNLIYWGIWMVFSSFLTVWIGRYLANGHSSKRLPSLSSDNQENINQSSCINSKENSKNNNNNNLDNKSRQVTISDDVITFDRLLQTSTTHLSSFSPSVSSSSSSSMTNISNHVKIE
ncbi:phosphatidylserine synthase 1 [Schistosoma bovis]|uniref:Phosphatidylserine synthase n=1 Tax=Schistosoma bovis TaxID=6184 RepID=A0A430QLV3_SCHBO|nr:phosphatidylserine synthase 1 [Schistosoma bovis]